MEEPSGMSGGGRSRGGLMRGVRTVATAEGLDQLYGKVDLLRLERGHALFGDEQLLAYAERLQVAAHAGAVTLFGQAPGIVGRIQRALLRLDLDRQRLLRGVVVGHLVERADQ